MAPSQPGICLERAPPWGKHCSLPMDTRGGTGKQEGYEEQRAPRTPALFQGHTACPEAPGRGTHGPALSRTAEPTALVASLGRASSWAPAGWEAEGLSSEPGGGPSLVPILTGLPVCQHAPRRTRWRGASKGTQPRGLQASAPSLPAGSGAASPSCPRPFPPPQEERRGLRYNRAGSQVSPGPAPSPKPAAPAHVSCRSREGAAGTSEPHRPSLHALPCGAERHPPSQAEASRSSGGLPAPGPERCAPRRSALVQTRLPHSLGQPVHQGPLPVAASEPNALPGCHRRPY